MDAGAVQGRRRNINALLGGQIDATRLDRLGGAGQCGNSAAGDVGRAAHEELAERADAEGNRHRMVSNSPFGIGGPKGMDPAVVKVLHDAFKKGMEEPSYKDTIPQARP